MERGHCYSCDIPLIKVYHRPPKLKGEQFFLITETTMETMLQAGLERGQCYSCYIALIKAYHKATQTQAGVILPPDYRNCNVVLQCIKTRSDHK